MNWGKWIFVSFVFFLLFIGSLVTVCINQDINLVSDDYYVQEIAYQKQLDRKNNARRLPVRPQLQVLNGSEVQLTYPELSKISYGTLVLFRPSNASLDKQFAWTGSIDTIRNFALDSMASGLYTAQLTWTMEEKEYYWEEPLILP